jgi:tetratricopeptide (TPR) repeat protein
MDEQPIENTIEQPSKPAIVKKPIFKKWWFWVIIVLLFAAFSGDDDKNSAQKTVQTAKDPVAASTEAYNKGVSFFTNKDYENTIESLKVVVEKDPNYDDAQAKLKESKTILSQQNLANAKNQIASNNFDNALALLNKAIAYNPNLTEASDLIPVVQQKKQAYLAQLKQQEVVNYKNSCKTLEYKVLNKNPDSLKGTKVKLKGKIMQIQESNNSTFMLLEVTYKGYDIWSDNVAVAYAGKVEAYDGDVITLWGEVTGAFSYKSKAGWNLTVPGVRAMYF